MPAADLIIANASQIITCLPRGEDPLGRVAGGVAVRGETILAVGDLHNVDTSSATVVDATGKIAAPGFSDSHTHLVFGGSRVSEYAARLTRSLAEVQALGIPTGIIASVDMTRAATADELAAGAAKRLRGMLRCGTTTVESKSGYGLTLADELKLLQVNRRLQSTQPVDIVSTFLGAHDFPRDMPREQYIDLIIHGMIPQVAAQKLAEFCDVFCDEGYYTVEQSRRILEAGVAAGLKPKLHADQYSAIGASSLAAEMGIVSADHLNYTDGAAARRMAAAGVVGVVTPALDFAVRHPRPFDARALLAEGVTLALATDLCPACWVESMQLVMQLACRLHRLSPEEALLAATVGGARALGLTDRGTLAPGQLADIQLWNVPTFEDVIYRLGNNAVDTVIKRGKIVSSQNVGANLCVRPGLTNRSAPAPIY